MPFPMSLNDVAYDSPRALAGAVMTALRNGQTVHEQLVRLFQAGSMSAEEAVGMSAALIQTRHPAAVVAGSHLAQATADASLADLLLLAHGALDMGTLLQTANGEESVEDRLLTAASHCVQAPGPVFDAVLDRLRNAGLARQELDLLARIAPPEVLRTAVPAVLLEGLPPGSADGLARAMRRDTETGEALADALTGLSSRDRTTLWAAMARHGVTSRHPDLVARLFPDRSASVS